MTTFDTGDIAVLSYVLIDSEGAAYQPATDGRVVARVYLPDGSLGVAKTWLAAGGGDAELVNDGPGLFHIDYVVTDRGTHRFEFQAYQGDEDADNSLEREVSHFLSRG